MARSVHPRAGFRRWIWGGTVLLAAGVVWAQDGPGPAELRRMYDDVVAQLKSAQDRKNELAGENDRLVRRLAEADRKLADVLARNAELERESAGFAEKTYQYRSTQAAWRTFLQRHPDVSARWNRYLDAAGQGDEQSWLDLSWPFVKG